jgi:GntR family transcriptional regulator/MocR family aminotransferase
MASSRYTKHILKMKKSYRSKMLFITNRLRELFVDEISINGENSGLHIAVSFKSYRFDGKFAKLLLQNGISIDLLTEYQHNPAQDTNTLIFGFGNMEPKEMETGLLQLKEILNSYGRADHE